MWLGVVRSNLYCPFHLAGNAFGDEDLELIEQALIRKTHERHEKRKTKCKNNGIPGAPPFEEDFAGSGAHCYRLLVLV